jgi:hypothetical protein
MIDWKTSTIESRGQIAGEYSEYFDKISDMFEEIGYILSCLRRYPRLYILFVNLHRVLGRKAKQNTGTRLTLRTTRTDAQIGLTTAD